MKRIAAVLLFLLVLSTFGGCSGTYEEYNSTGVRF